VDFTPAAPWTLATTLTITAGPSSWMDPTTVVPFKRYIVRHVCP
jgi:hypothetical protein